MASQTFTNTQLVTHWNKAANSNGTRRDVVLGIMGEMGVKDTKENYRKAYNNVTQRVKQLSEGTDGQKLVFRKLSEGKKGARRSNTELQALQAILDAPATADNADKGSESYAESAQD